LTLGEQNRFACSLGFLEEKKHVVLFVIFKVRLPEMALVAWGWRCEQKLWCRGLKGSTSLEKSLKEGTGREKIWIALPFGYLT